MRLIDADELMEHVWRDKLDSRELIAAMIEKAPTINMTEEEKKMLNMAKDISNYCNSQKCSDCIFCENPQNPNGWCTLYRVPARWSEYIKKKENEVNTE